MEEQDEMRTEKEIIESHLKRVIVLKDKQIQILMESVMILKQTVEAKSKMIDTLKSVIRIK